MQAVSDAPTKREQVQLFTRTGFLVSTVELPQPQGLSLPQAVLYNGCTYVLTQGRYLKVETVGAKAVFTESAVPR